MGAVGRLTITSRIQDVAMGATITVDGGLIEGFALRLQQLERLLN